MEIECVGEISEEGKIAVEPSLLEEIEVGSKVRLKISVPENKQTKMREKSNHGLGATPMIPYGRHNIDGHDIDAVIDVLKSEWLTTGPLVEGFEKAVADYVDSKNAVAMSSGTASLHAAMYALGIKSGDEVIVRDNNGNVAAVGKAVLTSKEMMLFKNGLAVNVRRGRDKHR